MAERNPEKHRETRKLLSHGFSARALKTQESIIHDYTNLFVSQLKKHGTEKALNMREVRAAPDFLRSTISNWV